MSKNSNRKDREPKIHKVDSEIENLPKNVTKLVDLTPVDDEVGEFGGWELADFETVVLDPEDEEGSPPEERITWASVKDSTETLSMAWEHVHGVRLAQSDLFAIMYTHDHKSTVLKYLESL